MQTPASSNYLNPIDPDTWSSFSLAKHNSLFTPIAHHLGSILALNNISPDDPHYDSVMPNILLPDAYLSKKYTQTYMPKAAIITNSLDSDIIYDLIVADIGPLLQANDIILAANIRQSTGNRFLLEGQLLSGYDSSSDSWTVIDKSFRGGKVIILTDIDNISPYGSSLTDNYLTYALPAGPPFYVISYSGLGDASYWYLPGPNPYYPSIPLYSASVGGPNPFSANSTAITADVTTLGVAYDMFNDFAFRWWLSVTDNGASAGQQFWDSDPGTSPVPSIAPTIHPIFRVISPNLDEAFTTVSSESEAYNAEYMGIIPMSGPTRNVAAVAAAMTTEIKTFFGL